MTFRRRMRHGVVSKEDEIDLLIAKGEQLVLQLSQAVETMQDQLAEGGGDSDDATQKEEEDGSIVGGEREQEQEEQRRASSSSVVATSTLPHSTNGRSCSWQ